jgi:hypothetical protein
LGLPKRVVGPVRLKMALVWWEVSGSQNRLVSWLGAVTLLFQGLPGFMGRREELLQRLVAVRRQRSLVAGIASPLLQQLLQRLVRA